MYEGGCVSEEDLVKKGKNKVTAGFCPQSMSRCWSMTRELGYHLFLSVSDTPARLVKRGHWFLGLGCHREYFPRLAMEGKRDM